MQAARQRKVTGPYQQQLSRIDRRLSLPTKCWRLPLVVRRRPPNITDSPPPPPPSKNDSATSLSSCSAAGRPECRRCSKSLVQLTNPVSSSLMTDPPAVLSYTPSFPVSSHLLHYFPLHVLRCVPLHFSSIFHSICSSVSTLLYPMFSSLMTDPPAPIPCSSTAM